jgi:arylsulfatase A-like enzyme
MEVQFQPWTRFNEPVETAAAEGRVRPSETCDNPLPGRSQWSLRSIGGEETNQYYPAVNEGTTPIEPDKTPEEGYHFTEDMTNKAIKWVRQQKALTPDHDA